jgi:hypothetical protein
MFLLYKQREFQTRILDIAKLLLLKLAKEPHFKKEKHYVVLYTKILSYMQDYRDALDFMKTNSAYYAKDPKW